MFTISLRIEPDWSSSESNFATDITVNAAGQQYQVGFAMDPFRITIGRAPGENTVAPPGHTRTYS